MGVFFADSLESLRSVASRPSQLAIFEREKPAEADPFFASMASISFGIAGEVNKGTLSRILSSCWRKAFR